MKTASMILGIIGGAIAILSGITLILFSVYFFGDGSFFFDSFEVYGGFNGFDSIFQFITTSNLIFGILSIAGGGCGLAGGILVKKKSTAAGILLIIGAVLTFSLLFILAAIFAFMKEKEPVPATAYGYPPQYPPYPPQYAPYPPQYTAYPPQFAPYPPQQTPPTNPVTPPTDQKPQQ